MSQASMPSVVAKRASHGTNTMAAKPAVSASICPASIMCRPGFDHTSNTPPTPASTEAPADKPTPRAASTNASGTSTYATSEAAIVTQRPTLAVCYTGGTDGPSCFDGVVNQGETGLDCGGPCEECIPCFPSSVSFSLLHAWCGSGAAPTLTFTVNGLVAATAVPTQACVCNSAPMVVTVTDPAVLATVAGCGDALDVAASSGSSSLQVGYLSATVMMANGAPQTACMYDKANAAIIADTVGAMAL